MLGNMGFILRLYDSYRADVYFLSLRFTLIDFCPARALRPQRGQLTTCQGKYISECASLYRDSLNRGL